MDQIDEQIWIGNYLDAEDGEALKAAGIHSVLGLNGRGYTCRHKEWGIEKVEVFDLIDGAGNDPDYFVRAVDALARLLATAPPLLVHCHAGQSRSAVVLAVLVGVFVVRRFVFKCR